MNGSARRARLPAGQVAASIAATLGLLVLLVGVPILLVALVGNPVPTRNELADAISTRQLDDSTLIRLFALLAWAIWAQLVVSTGLDLDAAIRARAVRRVVFLRPAQWCTGRLVAAAIVVASTLTSRAPSAEPTRAVAAAIALAEPAPPTDPPSTTQEPPRDTVEAPTAPTASVGAGAPPAGEPAPRYTVQRGDTLWSIAERYLGDAYRWREIEILNHRRPQPDGGALEPGGPIRSGWQLLLPADAHGLDPPPPPTTPTGTITVVEGDTLWDLAGRHLGDPTRWPDLFDANRDHLQPDGAALSDPDLIRPGWQLTIPSTAPPPAPSPAPPPPPVAPSSPPTSPPPSTPAPSPPDPEPAAEASDDRSAETARDTGVHERLVRPLLGTAFLAAGVVGVVAALRRRQQRSRPPGRRLPPLPGPSATTETVVRAAADASPADWLAAASRALTAALARQRTPGPVHPVGAHLTSEALEVFLAAPTTDAPPPWNASPDHWVWALPRATSLDDLQQLADDASPAMPALTTIGTTTDGTLLLDLEGAGLVAATGTGAADLVRTMTWELAVSGGADWADVVVVDAPALGATDADRHEIVDVAALTDARVRVVSSLDEGTRLAAATAASMNRALDAEGWHTTMQARAGADDTFAPTVLVLPAVPSDDHARDELADLVGDGSRGVAVLAVGDWPDAPWQLEVSADTVRIPRLGTQAATASQVEPASVSAEAASDLGALLNDLSAGAEHIEEAAAHDAGQDELVLITEPMTGGDANDQPATSAANPNSSELLTDTGEFIEEPFDVEVRVLGDIDATGLTGPLEALALECLVYLATHTEQPPTPEHIRHELWPLRAPSQARWSNVISQVRKALGTDADGQLHLPHQHGHANDAGLALGPRVRCDLTRMAQRLEAANHATGETRVGLLRDALSLVRGKPFTNPRPGGYRWANGDNTLYWAEGLVVDTAHFLAEALLEAGVPEEALRATDHIVHWFPHDEGLHRDRLRAHHARGDRPSLERQWNDLLNAKEAHDPSDLEPETVQVYEHARGDLTSGITGPRAAAR